MKVIESAEKPGEYISPNLPTADDIDRSRLVRHVRGEVYKARLRLNRLVGAADGKPNMHQRRTISQQRALLAAMVKRAEREGINVDDISAQVR